MPLDNSTYGNGRASSVAMQVWSQFLEAILVSVPLLAFLFVYRWFAVNLYVSYSLRVLGEFPKGFLFDLFVILVVLFVWAVASLWKWSRALMLTLLVPAITFLVLFRATDHYYYSATKVPLNAFVLYGNLSSANEGAAVVLGKPLIVSVLALLLLHYVVYVFSQRYRSLFERGAAALTSRKGWLLLAPVGAIVLMLFALEARALRAQDHKADVLRATSGEYMFVIGLPRFFREEALKSYALAPKPERFYLPAADSAPVATPTVLRKPNVFIITVESFNSLYVLPPAELNPALTADVMPFFKSLANEGYMFSDVYTSSAYTFNGIIAVLCSQYTMSESVWGKDCLPQVLTRNGYEAFSFVSIPQLRPYRYDNFTAMGFQRSRVFDAIRMRARKRNVYFDAMNDGELLGYAGALADSVAKATTKPMFVHVSTDAMHVPGGYPHRGCGHYDFPRSLQVEDLTRRMIDAAHCTDHDLSEFVAHLKKSGLWDDAVVVIMADHAFNLSFWNHKENELARIPLFVKLPKSDTIVRKVQLDQLAAQVDVTPTVLDYLGIHSTRPMYGRSLLASTVPASRSVVGVSGSRLLSRATKSGLQVHMQGTSDLADTSTVAELNALFATVLYFDQNPKAFEPAARNLDPSVRWPPAAHADKVIATVRPTSRPVSAASSRK